MTGSHWRLRRSKASPWQQGNPSSFFCPSDVDAMQRLRKGPQTASEALLARAIHICCQNEQMLGQRLAEILRLPTPKPTRSEGSVKPLDEALRILAYVGAEHQLQGPIRRDQIDACIQEIVAGLAATLVRDASPRLRS